MVDLVPLQLEKLVQLAQVILYLSVTVLSLTGITAIVLAVILVISDLPFNQKVHDDGSDD